MSDKKEVPVYCYQCVAGPDLLKVEVEDGVATHVVIDNYATHKTESVKRSRTWWTPTSCRAQDAAFSVTDLDRCRRTHVYRDSHP